MLFFRSEEQVNAWCAAKGLPRRPLISLSQLWKLAQAWYAERLSPAARRPGPDEMRQIFARVGLEGALLGPQGGLLRLIHRFVRQE